jgi:hypothetical protein
MKFFASKLYQVITHADPNEERLKRSPGTSDRFRAVEEVEKGGLNEQIENKET